MYGRWDSAMSIASRYGLNGSEWNPGGNEIFRTVRTDPKAHPTSYEMVTEYFLGAKRPDHCDDHPPPSSAEVHIGLGLTSAMLWGSLNLLNKYIYLKKKKKKILVFF